MYLISAYFDEKTNQRIQQYINQAAARSGNRFMIEGNVPPHLTISAFEAKEEAAVCKFQEITSKLSGCKIQFASVGQFFPYVMYITPVLSEDLHKLSENTYQVLDKDDGIRISPYYRPFQWLPHVTIGKKLTREQMEAAFCVMQESFGMFEGTIVKIGLAKTNPYQEISNYFLR